MDSMEMESDPAFFEPRDEMILHFLRLFVFNPALYAHQNFPIIRRDIYSQVPSLLFSGHHAHAQRLYFLTTLKAKFDTGHCNKKDRVVGNGYWHPQRTTPVHDPSSDKRLLGYMTMLNFFESAPPTGVDGGVARGRGRSRAKAKSEWIMHEYTLPYPGDSVNWAICCIYKSSHATAASASASSTQVDEIVATADLVPSKGNKRKAHHLEEDKQEEEDPKRPRPTSTLPPLATFAHDQLSSAPTLIDNVNDLFNVDEMIDSIQRRQASTDPTPTMLAPDPSDVDPSFFDGFSDELLDPSFFDGFSDELLKPIDWL